jgi:6-hydroxycyclohex-1-ene-1-carbonyl-CoA dehydrogenase
MSIDTAPPADATDALPATMRAAVFTGGGKPLELRIVPRPTPGPGELLVRVVACGLCHSDLHYLDHGTPTFKTPPLILGHEISGTVVDVGPGVSPERIGEGVVLSSISTCGACAACRTGRENQCAVQRMIGNSVDGGLTEYVVWPARDAFSIPPELPLEDASVIADALTTAYHAVVRRGRLVAGETVAIFGCGGVGLSAVQVAAMTGARVIAIDIDPTKLALARAFGAELAYDAKDPDLVKALKRATSGGPDLAIEAIGKPEVQEQALSVVRTGGRLVLLGFAAKPMSLPGGRVTFRELEIIGTLGCRNVDFPVVIDLVRRGKLAITPLVSHRHRLEEVNAGLDALRAGTGIRHIVVIE